MIYLAIDTCSWKNLVFTNEINAQLELLNYWYENNHIQFIVPKILIQEWTKHREEEDKKIESSLNTIKKHASQYAKMINFSLPETSTNEFNIKKQIEIIDNLIFNSSNIADVSEKMKATIADKQTYDPPKAPFHNKFNSMKDAYIYFSTLEFCNDNNISNILFISDNINDYGEPIPNSNKCSNSEIHHDLLTDFINVTVEFYGKTDKAIHEIKQKYNLPSLTKTNNNSDIVISKQDEISYIYENLPQKENLPILEFVYQIFILIYKEIEFVPLHILQNIPPFKIDNKKYTYYNYFTLTTNNTELYELLKSLKSNPDAELDFSNKVFFENVENYEYKADFILKKLTNNLVFNINLSETHNQINIIHSKPDISENISNSFNNFEFHKSFKLFAEKPSDIIERLKFAYYHYQTGNYLFAADLYKEILQDTQQEGKNIINFICNYNLLKLSIYIRNNYFGRPETDNLYKELKTINLNEISLSLNNGKSNKLFNWINNSEFFNNSFENIIKYSDKIIDHYFLQLNGGWSSNGHIKDLINEFAKLDYFLNRNLIIYDNFSEFYELFQKVIEGLFASHAISDKQGDKLFYFDDYWLSKIIYYGKKDEILKYFRRYKLKQLKYNKTSKEKDTFVELIRSILTNEKNTKNAFVEYCEEDNRVFWDKYNRIFENILVLISLTDISETDISEISKLILDFLSEETSIVWHRLDALNLFFDRKGKYIDKTVLEELTKVIIAKPKTHKKYLLETIFEQFKFKGNIELEKADLDILIKNCLNKCESCGEKHNINELSSLFSIAKPEFREIIKNEIENNINENFNAEIFYIATLMDIIPFNETNFEKYFQFCKPKENQQNYRSLFSRHNDYIYFHTNNLLNLCLKFVDIIDIKKEKFEVIKNINPYYTWLLDMDNFDYSTFDIDWILEYETIYFLRYMNKSEKLKNFIKNYMKENNNNRVEKLFIEMNYYTDN